MSDIIFIAVIVAFFVAAALIVRVLDGMIAAAGREAGAGEDDDELSGSDRPGAARHE